jgi:hypothetical protein
MNEQSEVIKCPRCKSEDWSCWDEQWDLYEGPDDVDSPPFTMPVGYLRCRDCGCAYENDEGATEGYIRIDDHDDW